MSGAVSLLLWMLAGTGVAVALGCVPGFHIYNLLAALFLAAQALPAGTVAPDRFAALTAAAVAAWSVAGILPAVFGAVPDESTALMLSPAAAARRRGQGRSAVLTAGAGALGGAMLLLAALPLLGRVLPPLLAVLRPHFYWILWALILYLPLSEWPKGGTRGPAGWARFRDGSTSWCAGLATLLLAGALGLILMLRSPFPPDRASLALGPALIGLFAVPALLQSMLARPDTLPAESVPRGLCLRAWIEGTLTGTAGGGIAALLPAVTGGLGSLLAGQAAAQSDDRSFLAAQGASRLVYYAGSLLLLAVPGVRLVRGGAAWQLQTLCPTEDPALLPILAAGTALGASLAFLALGPLSACLPRLWSPRRLRAVATAALGLLLLLTGVTTGWTGLAVLTVAAAIGAIPLLFHARRLNGLGVVLIPVAWLLTRSAS